MKKILLFCLLISQSAWASMDSSYQDGGSYASSLQESAKATLPKSNLSQVPGFKTADPVETTLNKNGNFSDATSQSLKSNKAGQTIIETAKRRERFKIDPTTDPLFKVQNEKSAEQQLNIPSKSESDQKEGFIEKTCEEGGEEITLECHEKLDIQVNVVDGQVSLGLRNPNLIGRIIMGRDIRPEHLCTDPIHLPLNLWDQFFSTHSSIVNKDLHFFKTKVCPALVSWGKINIDCNTVQSYTTHHADNTCDRIISTFKSAPIYGWLYLHIQFKTQQIASEQWSSNCQTAESLVEEGVCQYADRICSAGPETRIINGLPIYRDCWQYKQRYQCKMIKDECSPLRAKGCHQTGSKCKEMQQGRCWIYEQRYQCPDGKKSTAKIKSPALEAFCLTGDCHNSSYQANGEMLDVISRLSLLKQIQDDIRSLGNGNFQVFKGNHYQCTRNCVSFKDCCGGLKGWGVSLRIAGCSEEEKQLSTMREQNLCHQIGTYCSKKVLGKCVSKKTSFCCFGTKFARLLQQQGRPQFGQEWGSAECPDCRGFSVEELSKMDLSKLDFREVFDEVIKKYKEPNQKQLQDLTTQKINENFKTIEESLKQKKPLSPLGVMNDNKTGL